MSFQEKNEVIIEIGQFYTKVGIGMDSFPFKVIRTYKHFIFSDICLEKDKYGERVLGPHNKSEKMNDLHDFLDDLLFNVNMIDPSDKNIIVGLNLLVNKTFIEMLVEIFFDRLKVGSLILIPNNFLPLYMTGLFSGLVIDSGLTDTYSLPVYKGTVQKQAFEFTPLGSLNVARKIREIYKKIPKNKQSKTISRKIEDLDFLLNTSHNYCQVLPFQVAKKLHSETGQEVINALEKKKVNVFEGREMKLSILSQAIEEYFYQETFPDIVEIILQSIRKCPKAMREDIVSNIVLAGGGFLYKGMVERLRIELITRAETERDFRSIAGLMREKAHFVEIDYPCNLLSWAGAKISGYVDQLKINKVTKNTYFKDKEKVWRQINRFFYI